MKRTDSFVFVLVVLSLQVFVSPFTCCAEDRSEALRTRLVRDHIVGAGITNQRVIDAIRATPRHEFVPADVQRKAYLDMALPIGFGQTISSPYIVARMTEQLDPQSDDRILEIGTGSGYQAAVLSPLVKEVFSIEIVPGLGTRARETLKRLGYRNVSVRIGDGYQGWEQHAPYDKIIVTCSPEDVPAPLVAQLVEGGRLVIPVGERFQQALYRFTKRDGKLERERVEATFFVPMEGRAEALRRGTSDEVHPEIVNGGFEERTFSGEPEGWYYVRNGKVIEDDKAPQGKNYMRFQRRDGMAPRAIQPLAADGSKLEKLEVKFWSRGRGIQADLLSIHQAQVVVEFYDADRERCGDGQIPVSAGTFDWKQHSATIEIPKESKLAMIQIGLIGAKGEIMFDGISVSAK